LTKAPCRATPAAAALVLVCSVPSALAGSGGEAIDFNGADQAAARAAIIRRADLRSKRWTGGPIKPDLTPPETCRNWRPKQSDLVLTGAAESNFHQGPLRWIDSEVKVLRTARMVTVDWRREQLAPGVLSCQRRLLRASFGPGARVASFVRVPFPHIAPHAVEYRAIVGLAASQGEKARFVVDLVLVSRRRSELSLVTLAPFAQRSEVAADQRRLIRIMLSRAKA
jgi:hypothetical protein